MSNFSDISSGIWQYIQSRAHVPERNEIAQIIGRSLIDRNTDLLAELKALKDIIFESSGGKMSRENNFGKSKKTTGRRAISEAQQYSQLHYGEETLREASVLDLIFGTSSFTTESVADSVDLIREAFHLESVEINQEIDRLNDNLSGDFGGAECDAGFETLPQAMSNLSLLTNTPTTNPVPSERTEICSVCNTKRPLSSLVQSSSNKRGSGGGSGSGDLSICNMCHTTRLMRDAKISSSGSNCGSVNNGSYNRGNGMRMVHSQSTPAHLTAHLSVNDEEASCSGSPFENNRRSNNENSPDGAPKSARGSSRFRSRLDSARNQHHFLDEF